MIETQPVTIPASPATKSSRSRYSLTIEEVDRLREFGNAVPLYREIIADLETPVSAYLKIASGRYSFLLESVEGGQHLSRYSFIGTDPYLTVRFEDGIAYANQQGYKQEIAYTDPLVTLQSFLAPYQTVHVPGLPLFLGGAVGYLSYESVRHFENIPLAVNDPVGAPDGVYMFVDTMVVFDHLERRMKIVSHVHLDRETPIEKSYREATGRIDAIVALLQDRQVNIPVGDLPLHRASAMERATFNISRNYYDSMVERAKNYITAGDVFQVVPSQRAEVETGIHPFSLYRSLRTINPSPYMYYLQLGGEQVIGASPEALIRLEDGVLTTHPIAGTRPRGDTEEEDVRLEADLLADEKERAEHVMLVDLARNDLGKVAKPGTVRVPVLLRTDRFSHVIHLVSHVNADLQDDLTHADALRACFPAGTVSGAPKIRAMEIIAELEPDRRGLYSGVVGYFAYTGNMDQALALRTVVMRGSTATMQAGGGIVNDSNADYEYRETINKMTAAMRAIDYAEEIEAEERARAERRRQEART